MGWVKWAAAFAVATGSVWACGGSDNSSIGTPSTTDGGGDASATYTLDDVCARTGQPVCDIRQPCCMQTGGYDNAGCLAHTNAECANDVQAVREGRETFHPEKIDPCLAKLKDLYAGTSCYVTFDLIYAAAQVIADCRIFEGSLPAGSACERDSQCQPGGANTFTSCDSTQKVCKTTQLLAASAPCTIEDGLPSICSKGLYCDADFTKTPASGTCKTATPLGEACDATKANDLECGFGNYCNAGACAAGKSAGNACQSSLECQSLTCNPDKTCAAPGTLSKPEECKGP
jgi:hypothetical protein